MLDSVSPRAPLAAVVNAVARFRRDQDGSMSVLAIFLFVLMILMGGVAIDFMRYETTRTQLQNTLDRCTLMAASMDQSLDPQMVVTDCVAKAGLIASLDSVTVTEGANSRDIRAKARQETNPFFLGMLGINQFDAKAVAGAQQTISNVEISMVLDISGSMEWNGKIGMLKVAASEFVDTILSNDPRHRVSISMVPFNGQVNLGAPLRSQYNAIDVHATPDMNCLDLPASVYTTSAMPRSLPIPMAANVDTYSYATAYESGQMPGQTVEQFFDPSLPENNWAQPIDYDRWCKPYANNVVRPMGTDIATLQAQINGLHVEGATSINAGFKWGLALLDPEARPAISALAAQGVVENSVIGRPYDFNNPNAMKVIIVMTDGEHFSAERLNDGYRAGPSPLYVSAANEYSYFNAARAAQGLPAYWLPTTGTWQATALTSGAPAVRLDWADVWTRMNVGYFTWQFIARAIPGTSAQKIALYQTAMNQIRTKTPTGEMDSQLQQVCSLAKGNNVIVYGIAFEAPANGRAQIERCATSPAHYFNAQGLSIRTAFRTIAANLGQLKLTQ